MATPQMLYPPQEVLFREEEMEVAVETVREHDKVFGLYVTYSEPFSDHIWSVEAQDNPISPKVGLAFQLTSGHPITIARKVVLRENQCIDCGRDGIKYAARHQCNACYQREYRAQQRA